MRRSENFQHERTERRHWSFGKEGKRFRPGVNFTNVLLTAFMHAADPKSAKKTVKLGSFIALLGSLCVKAARRTLVKLIPGVHNSKSMAGQK